MKKKESEKLVSVWTVIPNDCEYCTVHYNNELLALEVAKSYKSGASVVQQLLPRRVIDKKERQIARRGYKL